MPLKILQLGPYPPPMGGISRNILAIRDEALWRGHSCAIVATSRSQAAAEEADVYHPRSAAGLLKLLASLTFDVVHLHIGGDVTKRVLAMAGAVTFFGRGRCVLSLHSGAYPLTAEGKNASPKSLRAKIFKKFSRIIAVNESIGDVFRRYGVADDRIRVILPFALEHPDDSVSVPDVLATFVKAYSPLLLAVGGLEKDYDPLFQIAAFGDVLKEFPGAGLMIAGDGSIRGEVETAVANSGYSESICIAGNVDHAVTLHLIKAADILLRTTLFDGDAISVRESLFLGTPVIATDNGMRPEGVHVMKIGDRTGFLNNVKECVSTSKTATPDAASDNSNITLVVDLYEELRA